MFVPFHPRQEPEENQKADSRGLEQLYQNAADFQHQTIRLAQGGTAKLYWLDGMVRNERLNDYVIRPLTTVALGDHPERALRTGGVWTGGVKEPENLAEAAVALTDGACIVELNGQLFLVPVATEEKRGVESPEDEPSAKGSKDSFVESVSTNTSLVRRRLHSWHLGVQKCEVGRESRTKVAILWMQGITDQALVDQAVERVQGMDVDALLSTQMLNGALTDTQHTMFPLSQITQRPDLFTQGLMDGQVGVLCDGFSQGFLVPGTSAVFLRAPQDRTDQWMTVHFLSFIRYLCVMFSLFLPAGYISMAAFHFGLMTSDLAETISASRQSVPLSPPLEVVMLLLAFEILQEAGLRLPQLTGQSVSIIGSLVVGQAAVDAKLLSPVVVVVIATAGIAGYTLPNTDLANALRAIRFGLAVLSAFVGILGIMLGVVWLCCHLASLEPLGVPWLAPFAPDCPRGPWAATRAPVKKAKLREVFLHPGNVRNQK